jgi:hypothetical protein
MRRILEAEGYVLIDEDSLNWAFAKGHNDVPVIVPNSVRLLSVDVMNALFYSRRNLQKRILAELMSTSDN